MGVVFGKISEELPSHVVLHTTSSYEVWRFGSSVAATVHASSLATDAKPAPTGREFESMAFRMLARYIGVFATPQNKAATSSAPEPVAMTAPVVISPQPEKVAMTAPVVIAPQPEKVAMTAPVVLGAEQTESGQSMTFLLPSKYEKVEDAPVPENPAVKLSLAPAGRCEAVLRYSGNVNMDSATDKAKELVEMLERDGVKITGAWTVHGYNAPFVLPWFKRNEIHVPVDQGSIKEMKPPAENE